MLQAVLSVSFASDDDFFLKQLRQKNIETQKQLEQTKQIPDWIKAKPMKVDSSFEKVLNKDKHDMLVSAGLEEGGNPEQKKERIVGRWIFISLGMPAEEVRQAAISASDDKAMLVLRGVEPGSSADKTGLKLLSMINDVKPTPVAVIDPTLFSKFKIHSVPTMVENNKKNEIRIARGLPGFKWMDHQEPGDLGVKGQVFGILEEDMILELKNRMAKYDWEKEKARAIQDIWKNQDMFDLPVASKDSKRMVNLTIKSTQDIVGANGELLLKKGSLINPQTIMPMKHVYIVFDATDKNQIEIARKFGEEKQRNNKPVVYMFSKLNKEDGWKSYNEVGDALSAPVFKLSKTIIDRFQIQSLPCIIEGEGDHLLVTEIDVVTKKTN